LCAATVIVVTSNVRVGVVQQSIDVGPNCSRANQLDDSQDQHRNQQQTATEIDEKVHNF